MTGIAKWKRTWGEVGIEDMLRERWSWMLTVSTGVDAFSLGIVIKRPLAGEPFILGIGLLFCLIHLEVWP